jgi:hypothetical protein
MNAIEDLIITFFSGVSNAEFEEFKKLNAEVISKTKANDEDLTLEDIIITTIKAKRLLWLAEKRNEVLLATLN